MSQPPQPSNPTGKSSRICRHFIRGMCTWGSECRFSHAASPEMEPVGYQQPPPPAMMSAMPMMHTPSIIISPTAAAGQQQAEQQRQRYSLVTAGATGMFTMQINGDSAIVTVGALVFQFTLIPQMLLQQHLSTVDPRGGLNYLAGETSIFWSMMKYLHTEGSTGSPYWDQAVRKALNGQVPCMFFQSSTGCLAPGCPYLHESSLISLMKAAPVSPSGSHHLMASAGHLSQSSFPDVNRSRSGHQDDSNLSSSIPSSQMWLRQQLSESATSAPIATHPVLFNPK